MQNRFLGRSDVSFVDLQQTELFIQKSTNYNPQSIHRTKRVGLVYTEQATCVYLNGPSVVAAAWDAFAAAWGAKSDGIQWAV